MTEMNIEQLNEVATRAVESALISAESPDFNQEDFLGDVYGRMVAASALGWDIGAMAESAAEGALKLVNAAEASANVEG